MANKTTLTDVLAMIVGSIVIFGACAAIFGPEIVKRWKPVTTPANEIVGHREGDTLEVYYYDKFGDRHSLTINESEGSVTKNEEEIDLKGGAE